MQLCCIIESGQEMRKGRYIAGLLIGLLILAAALAGCGSVEEEPEKLAVKVLVLPKFEIGEFTADVPGEAQYYFEEYMQGCDTYEVEGCEEPLQLYYKDGVAMCMLGQGKVSAAINTMAVLSDTRFDFSDAYVISTGCAGVAKGYGVLGDVFIVTAVEDYDLGHNADPREMTENSETTWFHIPEYDEIGCAKLDPQLTEKVFNLVKDEPLATTEESGRYMAECFPGEEWAARGPQVLKGTGATSDNYWKGEFDHKNALLITETYGCPDPFAVTEMEDIAIARVLRKLGMLDRLIIIRDAVNMDVFAPGSTPESLWGAEAGIESTAELTSDLSSEEYIDIFPVAMENNFKVGQKIITAILNGEL